MELAFGTDEPLCGQLQIYPYRHILCIHTSTVHTCKEMPFSLINLTPRALRVVLRQSLVGEGHVALPDFLGWASLVVEGGEVSLDKGCSLPQWRAASQARAWSISPFTSVLSSHKNV